MKNLYFILALLLHISMEGQKNLIIDKDHQIFQYQENLMYVDKQESSYIILLAEKNSADGPFETFDYKIKEIDLEGETLREKILFDAVTGFTCTKIGENYLIVVPSIFYENIEASWLITYLYDKEFNLLQKHGEKISDIVCSDSGSACGLSNLGKFYPKDSLLGLLIPYTIDPKKTNLLTLTFDKNGFFKKINVSEESTPQKGTTISPGFKNIDNEHIYFTTTYNVLEYDEQFNEVARINKFDINLPSAIPSSSVIVENGENYLIWGAELLPPTYDKAQSFGALIDKDLIAMEDQKTVFEHSNIGNASKYSYYTPDGCFNKEEDGNYTAIMSYNFNNNSDILLDTTEGKIIIARFDPQLNIICQKTYVVPGSLINIYFGSYQGQGEYLISGGIDTIEYSNNNQKKIYHPFIGYIKEGCDISWAKSISETLDSKPKITELEDIFLLQNPVTEYLRLGTSDRFDKDKALISIFDFTGNKAVINSVWNGQQCDINVSKLNSGMYLYVVSDRLGKLQVGKFIKI